MKYHITYTCPDCGADTAVTVWPGMPAQLYGPPDQCSPEEPMELSPEECAKCGAVIEADILDESIHDDEIAAQESLAEFRADMEREECGL